MGIRHPSISRRRAYTSYIASHTVPPDAATPMGLPGSPSSFSYAPSARPPRVCNIGANPFIQPGRMYSSFTPAPRHDVLPPCPLTAKRAFVPLTTRPGSNGRTLKILYDSGAQASLLCAADFQALVHSRTPFSTVPNEGLTLTAANGSPIPYTRVIVTTLYTPSEAPIRVPFFVCPTATTSILGMNAIARFRLYLDPVRLVADVQRTADVSTLDASCPGSTAPPFRARVRHAAAIPGQEGITKCRMELVDADDNLVRGERTVVLDHLMTAAIVETDRNGRFTAPLSNLDHSGWNVARHDVVGQVSRLSDYAFISSSDVMDRMELAPQPARRHSDADKAVIRSKLSASLSKSAPPALHRKALDLLMSFEDVFSASSDDIGYCPVMEHTINLRDDHPIFRPQFQIPGEHLAAIKDQTMAWIKQGIVKRGRSPFNSPIFAVPKPHNRGLRIVLDFRGINDATLPDKYSIPSVDDTLNRIGDSGAQWFSSLDLSSGFYHIPLREGDQYITAYTIPGLGQFVWRRAAMGLTGSPATFNRVIDTILHDVDHCLSYVDDILCFTRDVPTHLETLARVLTRLRKAGLRVNPEKSVFLANEVDYLGASVSAKGIRPTIDKTTAVADLRPPSCRKSLSAVLGFFNYMSRYIYHYASKSAPLRCLARKEANYTSGDIPAEALRAFNRIKAELSSRPLVGYIVANHPLHLYVDAALGDSRNSGEGFGAVLLQDVPGSIMRPVAYLSRALQPHERNYPAGLAELKAITWAVLKLSPYLRHRRFYLYSDHRPLTDKMLGACHRKTFAHCETFMEDFYPIWRHVRGPSNVIADFLSRYHGIDIKPSPRGPSSPPSVLAEQAALSNCALVTHRAFNLLTTDSSMERLQWLQSVDPLTSAIMAEIGPAVLGSSPTNPVEATSDRCSYPLTIWKGILMIKPRRRDSPFRRVDRPFLIFTPEAMRTELVNYAHGGHIAFSGHFGVKKTAERIAAQHWWPSMLADCKTMVRDCGICREATNKGVPPPPPRKPLPAPRRPNDRIHLDLQGPLTNRRNANSYVLIIIDALTKHLTLRVIPDKEATTVAKELFNYCMVFGVPKEVLTDNGLEFCNQVDRRMCHLLGITRSRSSVYHPQCNGLAEEANKTVQGYLTKCMTVANKDDAANFKDYILAIQFSYNTSFQSRSRMSPHDALFGYPARAPLWEDYDDVFSTVQPHDLTAPEFLLRRQRQLRETRAIAHHNFALDQEVQRRQFDAKHKARSPHYAPRQPIFLRRFVKAAVNPKFAPQWRRAYVIREFHPDVYLVFVPDGGHGKQGFTTKVNASHLKPAEPAAGWLPMAQYLRLRHVRPPPTVEADSQTEDLDHIPDSPPGPSVSARDVPRRPSPTPSLIADGGNSEALPDTSPPIFDFGDPTTPSLHMPAASPPSPVPGPSGTRIPLPSSTSSSSSPRSSHPARHQRRHHSTSSSGIPPVPPSPRHHTRRRRRRSTSPHGSRRTPPSSATPPHPAKQAKLLRKRSAPSSLPMPALKRHPQPPRSASPQHRRRPKRSAPSSLPLPPPKRHPPPHIVPQPAPFPAGRRPRRPRSSSSSSSRPTPPRRIRVQDPRRGAQVPHPDSIEEHLAPPPPLGTLRLPQKRGLRPYDEINRTQHRRGRPRKKRVRIAAAAPTPASSLGHATDNRLQDFIQSLLASTAGRLYLDRLLGSGRLPFATAPRASPAATIMPTSGANPGERIAHHIVHQTPARTTARPPRTTSVPFSAVPNVATSVPFSTLPLVAPPTVAPSHLSPPSHTKSRSATTSHSSRAGSASSGRSSPTSDTADTSPAAPSRPPARQPHLPAGPAADCRAAYSRNAYFARCKSQSEHLLTFLRRTGQLHHLGRQAADQFQHHLAQLRDLPLPPPAPRRRNRFHRFFRR